MPSNAPKGKLLMTQLTKRLLGVSASTVLLSLVSATAHAQTIDVLTFGTGVHQLGTEVVSIYGFSSSMILNSIGFVSSTDNSGIFKYRIHEGAYETIERNDPRLAPTVNGVRWFTLTSPVTLNANEGLYVSTLGIDNEYDFNPVVTTELKQFTSKDARANVSLFIPNDGRYNADFTNSNLKVTNPSSNVAPEPGTFALALTGGATLIGICIRRRRNAG
jgi:hypothetical protein